jgi:alanine racemase
VAPVARELGRRVLVSHEGDAAVAREHGLEAVVSRLAPAEVTDAAHSYGLDGTHRPVMTLIGELLAVKRVPAGSGVSYGYTHRTSSSTQLGLVGLGYADGVPRLGSNRASLSIDGARFPLVGRIAMDQLVIDLGESVHSPGAEVVVFGDPTREEPSALEWAAWTERTPLALTAGLGHRIRREPR